MSKTAKATARALRRQRKAARKAAQNIQYAAWKQAGQNTKSRRAKLRKRRTIQMRSRNHPQGACGNLGCERCHPEYQDLSVARPLVAA